MKRMLARSLLLWQVLGLAIPATALAEWKLSGSNTLRLDAYRVSGDESRGPYPEEGLFSYNELNFSLAGTPAEGHSLRFDFAGVYADSPYRSAFQGFVPESMRLVYDNRVAAIPFSLDLGDQPLLLSPLTLDRTLKAARLSLSPRLGTDGRRVTANLFVASDSNSWRDFDFTGGAYRGLGIEMSDAALGTMGVNLVNYSAEGADADLRQTVASVYGRREFDLAGQRLTVNGEWAFLRGQREFGGESVSGQGGFLQAEGRSQMRPLHYRLRYERYGEDFAPHGGSVIADSESLLGEADWNFQSGVQLRGGVSRLTEWRSSDNPLATDSVNLGVTTPLSRSDPDRGSVAVDARLQRQHDDEGRVDRRNVSLRASANLRHRNGSSTRVDAAFARSDDRRRSGRATRSAQLAASHTLDLELRGTKLTLTPGVSVSQSRGEGGSLTVGPTIAVAAERGNQRLALQVGQSEFDSDGAGDDYGQTRVSLDYELRRDNHTFGVEIDRELHEPERGEETDAWRAGAYWRYEFGG